MIAGIVGGFLANRWNWGVAAGAMTLIAVFVGLEGLKAMRSSRALPTDLPHPGQASTAGPGDGSAPVVGSIHMRQSVVAQNIGSVDLSRRTHVHLGGVAAVALAALMLLGTAGGTVTFAVGEGGRLASDSTPPGARYGGLFEQTSGPPWLAFYGLTSQEYQQKSNELTGRGFQLVQISGYALGTEERFAPIFEQGGPVTRAVHGPTSQYQQRFDEMSGQGLRVALFSDYTVGNEERYTAVFEPAGPSWVAFHGLTARQYQQKVDEVGGDGFRLVQITGYSVRGEEFFAPIFEQRSGPPLRAVAGLTSEEYRQRFDALTGQGYRLVRFSAYAVAGAERVAAIFEQGTGPPVHAEYGLNSDQYQQRFDALTKQGYRLVQFSAYTVG